MNTPYRMMKDWIYLQSAVKKNTFKFMLIGILGVYIFFFSSNFIIPHPVSSSYTMMGETYAYAADRSVTVYEVIYDGDADLLEITMELTNDTYDNINDYYFFLVPEGRHTYTNMTVETVIHDSMVTVLRVPNLKKFDEASLVFAPKISESIDAIPDDVVGTLIFNRNNITYGKVDLERSRGEYIQFRLQARLDAKQMEIDAAQSQLSTLENKYAALEDEIKTLQENMTLYTAAEQEAAMNKIEGNGELLLEVANSISMQKEEVQRLSDEYDEIYKLLHEQLTK